MAQPPFVPLACGYVNTGLVNDGFVVAPSVVGQPKLRPAPPAFTSSHAPLPTSLMSIAPVVRRTSNVNGLRKPSAQIARLTPLVVPKNGLSVGMVPSALKRSIFPNGVVMLCALEPVAL